MLSMRFLFSIGHHRYSSRPLQASLMIRLIAGLLLIFRSHSFQLHLRHLHGLHLRQTLPTRLPLRPGHSSCNGMLNGVGTSSHVRPQSSSGNPTALLQRLWSQFLNVRKALLKWWRGVWFEHFATYSVYVLALEGGKYYVGSSLQKRKRFAEHMSHRGGSSWTRDHKPLRMIESVDRLSLDACLGVEATKTAQYMWRYGVNSVRGAYFCQRHPFTAPEDVTALTGFLGHFNGLKYGEVMERLEKSLPKLPPTDGRIVSVKRDDFRRKNPPKSKRKSSGFTDPSRSPSVIDELTSLGQPQILVQLENINSTAKSVKDLNSFEGNKMNVRLRKCSTCGAEGHHTLTCPLRVKKFVPMNNPQASGPKDHIIKSANASKSFRGKTKMNYHICSKCGSDRHSTSSCPSVPDQSVLMNNEQPPTTSITNKGKTSKKRKALKEKKKAKIGKSLNFGSVSHLIAEVERQGTVGGISQKQHLMPPFVTQNVTSARSMKVLNSSHDVNAAGHIHISFTVSLPTYQRESDKLPDSH